MASISFQKRLQSYQQVGKKLASLDNSQLISLLESAKEVGHGIGGPVSILSIEGANVFVKRVRVTDLEMRDKNRSTTSNIFVLPNFYHYGVGSFGFGAWRELAAHQMTTEWVLNGVCSRFPLLFHSRVLEIKEPRRLPLGEFGSEDTYVAYWGDSSSIRKRVEALSESRNEIILFLEYFPETLKGWLLKKHDASPETQAECLLKVEQDLLQTTAFMKSKGFFHFDGHPMNILADEDGFYFSDFGLTTSRDFELSEGEREFLDQHRDYDTAFAMMLLGRESLRVCGIKSNARISEMIRTHAQGGKIPEVPNWVGAVLGRCSPAAALMEDFFEALKKNKSTPFPGLAVTEACRRALLR